MTDSDSLSSSDKMPQRYTVYDLQSIGTQCHNRLPPASAVQAMYLYEMQRQSEVESLFQGQMFKLAQIEQAAEVKDGRMWKLEKDMKELQNQITANDVHFQERLATTKAHMDAQTAELNARVSMAAESETARMDKLLLDVETFRQTQINDYKRIWAALDKLQHESDVLFDERDAIFEEQKKAEERLDKVEEAVRAYMIQQGISLEGVFPVTQRVDKLEDLVRALTVQQATSPISRSPVTVQRLPMKSTNGQLIDLSVPKGSPLVSAKENRASTFGVQWTG